MSNVFLKSEMDNKQLAIVASEFDKKKKSKGIAFALWWFTGIWGGHRFYMGDKGIAIGMLFTLGGLGFWALFDAFAISSRIDQKNNEIEREIISNIR